MSVTLVPVVPVDDESTPCASVPSAGQLNAVRHVGGPEKPGAHVRHAYAEPAHVAQLPAHALHVAAGPVHASVAPAHVRFAEPDERKNPALHDALHHDDTFASYLDLPVIPSRGT